MAKTKTKDSKTQKKEHFGSYLPFFFLPLEQTCEIIFNKFNIQLKAK